jgi:titin
LTAFASAGPRIGLTWADGSLDEDEFEIYRRTEGQPFAFRASAPANTTGYFDNTVAPDPQYYYQVRALNAGGASAFTAEAGARTLPRPPESPSGMRAAELGPTQVDLSWTDGSTNETGFQIQRRREGQGFSGLATTGPNTSTYADTSAAAGTKYYYRVRAVNTGGSSAYTLEASVTTPTPAGLLPAAPQQLQAVIVSATQVRLEWNDASTNEGGFRVERRIGAGGFVEIGSTPQNVRQYSDTSAAPGEAHVYRVRAFNDAGPSGFSNEAGALIPTGGKLKLSPKKLNFGRVSGPVTRTVRLTNTGRGPLAGTVGSLSAPYSVVSGGGPFQLGAKQSRTVTIRFAPAAAGSFTALLNVTSTDASKAAVGVAVSGKRR